MFYYNILIQMFVKSNEEMISKVNMRKKQCSDSAAPLPLYAIHAKSHEVFHGARISNLDLCLYREGFEALKHPLKNLFKDESRGDSILVSMHIRRGDVVNKDFAKSNRWIKNEAYIHMANELTLMLRALFQNKKKIHLEIFAENSKSIEEVTDVGESQFTTTDMRKRIIADNVTLGPAGLLESFSSMCYSDVLVTANSGFSSLILRVCRRPVSFFTYWESEFAACTPPNGIGMQLLFVNQSKIANRISFNSTQFTLMAAQKLLPRR